LLERSTEGKAEPMQKKSNDYFVEDSENEEKPEKSQVKGAR